MQNGLLDVPDGICQVSGFDLSGKTVVGGEDRLFRRDRNGGYCTSGQLCGHDGECLICSNRTDSCGGECGLCSAGARCRQDADCDSGTCVRGVCEGEPLCIEWGSYCTQHDECCTGLCRAISGGGLICEQCGGEGAACGNYAYCCPRYECNGSMCVPTPTFCITPPGACQTSDDFCQRRYETTCLYGICHGVNNPA